MFARNTPEGREAVLKQFKKDTVASWCATKGCSCKKYKVSLRDRITQIMDKLLR